MMMIVLYEFRDLTSTLTCLFLSFTLGLNLCILDYHNTLVFLTFYGFDLLLNSKSLGYMYFYKKLVTIKELARAQEVFLLVLLPAERNLLDSIIFRLTLSFLLFDNLGV